MSRSGHVNDYESSNSTDTQSSALCVGCADSMSEPSIPPLDTPGPNSRVARAERLSGG